MKKDYLKYFAGLLLFGSNGVVARFIALTSYEIVMLRSVLGAVLLTALYFLTGNKITALKYKKDLLFITLSGIAMAADWLFLFEAYDRIGVSLSILINYFGPVIVIALSPIVLKEKLSWQKVAALIAALSGVFLINGQAVVQGLNFRGLACAILSAVSIALMVLFNKKSKNITGMENATIQLLVTAVTVVIFMGFKQGFHMSIPADNALPVIWLGLINTGIGCYFYFSSISALPAQTVAVCGYIEPLSAVIFAVIFLHETMLPLQIAGAALILGGALFGEICKPKETRKPEIIQE